MFISSYQQLLGINRFQQPSSISVIFTSIDVPQTTGWCCRRPGAYSDQKRDSVLSCLTISLGNPQPDKLPVNGNSQKISNYKIKIHFRVNSIAFKKEKDYTNYEGRLTVWFLICQEAAKMDEAKMVLSYNKLWKMLIDRKLKKKDLQKMTHLSSSVIAKMGRDESVHLDTIVKICIALQCNISDIVELQRKEA